MKYILLSLVLLTGCATTVPVTAKFPAPPAIGTRVCPALQTVKNDVKLSELTNTVTQNYSTYYECAVRVDAWQEWYAIQKQIFEGVSK
jgi:hypothetical protein